MSSLVCRFAGKINKYICVRICSIKRSKTLTDWPTNFFYSRIFFYHSNFSNPCATYKLHVAHFDIWYCNNNKLTFILQLYCVYFNQNYNQFGAKQHWIFSLKQTFPWWVVFDLPFHLLPPGFGLFESYEAVVACWKLTRSWLAFETMKFEEWLKALSYWGWQDGDFRIEIQVLPSVPPHPPHLGRGDVSFSLSGVVSNLNNSYR